MYKIDNFAFYEYKTYFLDDMNLYYSEKHIGHLVEINIESGKQKSYDFGIKIRDLLVIEGKSVYYKCQDEFIYFVDLDWIFLKDNKKLIEKQKKKNSNV